MQERQKKILKSLVKEYQRTGEPVSSLALAEHWHFDFSPATMRAEMSALDQEGFLCQPHTSAGRLPTDKAYRFFIEELCDKDINKSEKEQIWQKVQRLHCDSPQEMAQFLADCTQNLGISGSFGRLMDFHEAGLRWLADEPEFEEDQLKNMLKHFDLLEKDFNKFFGAIDEEVAIFIGQENPIDYLHNCSLVITGFKDKGEKKVLGILGPKRMNYQKNKFVLEEARKRVSKQASK